MEENREENIKNTPNVQAGGRYADTAQKTCAL